MYSKEEVVELFNDFSENYGRNSYKEFLKEQGLIEPELEIGKWYHYGTDLLVWNGGDLTYGFSQGVDYLNGAHFSVDDATPAPHKEVSDAFIKEAQKYIGKVVHVESRDLDVLITDEFDFKFHNDATQSLWAYGTLPNRPDYLNHVGVKLFSDGKWAEIIEEESYSHAFTYGASNINLREHNEITVNGITYTKK